MAFILMSLAQHGLVAINNHTKETAHLTPGPPTESTRIQQTNVPRSAEDKKDMSVLYTNARSLIPKREELLAYLDVEKPDVVAITETWATSDHLMTEFSISGYKSFYKIRLHKKGGGVICYVKNIHGSENNQRGL